MILDVIRMESFPRKMIPSKSSFRLSSSPLELCLSDQGNRASTKLTASPVRSKAAIFGSTVSKSSPPITLLLSSEKKSDSSIDLTTREVLGCSSL